MFVIVVTEMGCGTSCSLMERVRTIDDRCHLCHYDMCNSGKKIIVERHQIKSTTIINNCEITFEGKMRRNILQWEKDQNLIVISRRISLLFLLMRPILSPWVEEAYRWHCRIIADRNGFSSSFRIVIRDK